MTTPEFEKYRNENGFETAAYVLPESGEYVIQGSGARTLPAGAVLIQLPRPDAFETVSGKEWEDMGMSPVNPPAPAPVLADFPEDDTGE